jgi:ankyrin repeat protein
MSDTDARSMDLLIDAISDGAVAKATALIDGGISPSGRDSVGQTPIFVAARDGKAEIVKLLASRGVDIDAPIYDGRRPLYWAADGGHLDTVRALLRLGVTIDARDNYNSTALWTSAHRLVIEMLNVPDKVRWQSEQSRNPRGHSAIAEALILAGADVNLMPSKEGLGSQSVASQIREAGIRRLVDLLEGRETPKRSFWSSLFGG